jgi:uncharacterized protein (TIGR00251 family)
LIYEVQIQFHKSFIRVEKKQIFVGLTSKPERGKANYELIKKIARYFSVSSTQVKIISGLKSKRKTVEIKE